MPIIRLKFTKEMIAESKRLADSMGEIKNSITRGNGNRSGFLGELALAKHLGAERIDTFNYDLFLDGKKIEVKTKRRTADPRGNYEGSVALTSGHQSPDFYAFLSLTFEASKKIKGQRFYFGLRSIWLCGMIGYEDFIMKSRLLKKGEVDTSNGFVVLTDMRNIKYEQLS